MVFCRGKNQKLLFKVYSDIEVSQVLPHTPEGAEALSPGQRPGLSCSQTWRPVRAKALKLQANFKAFSLSGKMYGTYLRKFCQ